MREIPACAFHTSSGLRAWHSVCSLSKQHREHRAQVSFENAFNLSLLLCILLSSYCFSFVITYTFGATQLKSLCAHSATQAPISMIKIDFLYSCRQPLPTEHLCYIWHLCADKCWGDPPLHVYFLGETNKRIASKMQAAASLWRILLTVAFMLLTLAWAPYSCDQISTSEIFFRVLESSANHSWVYLTILLLILGFSESRELLSHADAFIKEITIKSVSIPCKTENETKNRHMAATFIMHYVPYLSTDTICAPK